ncbi:lipopolysaccharide kinase InaA family protein [Endozoicomonas euniceicola]|uniref:Lipopolysaccharide kinase InaA family protein n=1 Tax=Endozoicomonas euniceicola TaxID=1234143 RepID=A0ABY6GYW2_9GAMM|nr:lipopolysaccharide kinase InaA family protein [Endozoicomonas euniceicola]UYM17976.1 lipopolysaccharide kinase InaA family protein [Endozoicomonas euniceicola]
MTTSSWTVTNLIKNTPVGEVFSSLEKVFTLKGEYVNDDKLSDIIRVKIQDKHYYVKRYTLGGKGIRKYIGRSRIRAEWENLLTFHDLGVPAAEVVAYGEERCSGLFKRGAAITEEFDNSLDMRQLEQHHDYLLKNHNWMNQVIDQVASAARTLHQNNFIHTDFKWRNILVTIEEKPRIALIDCPAGTKVASIFLERGIIKDLACLDKIGKKKLSKSQRMRFYSRYIGRKINNGDKRRIKKILSFFEGRE